MSLGRHLKKFAEAHGVEKTKEFLSEAKKGGKITDRQISIRDLAEGLVGPGWARALEIHSKGRNAASLLEANEAVDASAFTDITGQLLVDRIYEKYNAAAFVLSRMVDTMPVTTNLSSHKVPGLSRVVDDAQIVNPGMPIPSTSFAEQYYTLPATERRELMCTVTLEAIRSDLTGQINESADDVGNRLGIQKEERIARVMFGLVNPYIWNGTGYNTYLTSGNWINKLTGVTLTDWTTVNLIENLAAAILDPVSGRPIQITLSDVVVMPYRYYDAKRTLNATNTRTGNYPTSGQGIVIDAANPLEMTYNLVKSVYAYQQLTNPTASGGGNISSSNAREYFVIGDLKKAFGYREVEPMTTFVAPPGNYLEFHQSIALAVKAREWGVPAVKDPRYSFLGYNS